MADQYETFDSGSSVVIPEKDSKNYAHRDKELKAEGDAGQDKEKGVPSVPMK